ncbi:hypothetical protein HELRODRAFT_184441 [Helobdella robusta]|uniref:Uncharacterized protein n=1 Tax=Helobdella robusta TaxID=6412 RepID=T1FL75_HELRO|nr:hypothetical protein HELRODRAFT_184441 [Helobdella robusta]ESN96799.1 hypothetical protein HELRODRAFT_184441 [Helobdella robusta]
MRLKIPRCRYRDSAVNDENMTYMKAVVFFSLAENQYVTEIHDSKVIKTVAQVMAHKASECWRYIGQNKRWDKKLILVVSGVEGCFGKTAWFFFFFFLLGDNHF